MKLHQTSTGLKADQAAAFKALAAEVMEAGYHFFILHERVRSLCKQIVVLCRLYIRHSALHRV